MKKTLTVVVIFLFIGLAVGPCIHGVVYQEKADTEYVEFITETYGLFNRDSHIVKLTKQQAGEVNNIFDAINSRLKNVTTEEEATSIFNNALIELNKYGFFTKFHLEQMERLFKVEYRNLRMREIVEKMNNQNQKIFTNDSNFFCFVAGKTDYTYFSGPPRTRIFWPLMIFFIVDILYRLWELIPGDLFPLLQDFYELIYDVILKMYETSYLFFQMNPIVRRNIISLGSSYHWDYSPAHGWVYTLGLNGVQRWHESFWGDLPLVSPSIFYDTCPGIAGFRGIQIIYGENSHFYLGQAQWVRIISD